MALLIGAASVDLLVWSGDSTLASGQTLPVWVVPGVTLLVYPTLLLRRRRPLTVFAIQLTYAFASVLIPQYQPFAALLLALFAVARRSSTRTAVSALVASVVAFGMDSVQNARASNDPSEQALITFALWLAVCATVWGLSRLLLQVERRGELLRLAAASRAAQDERLRLARELHDIVAHSVSAMLLQAAGARAVAPVEAVRVRQALEVIESTGVSAMQELHGLLHLLRTSEIPTEKPPTVPGLADVDRLVIGARQSGLEVHLAMHGDLRAVDAATSLTGFRIIQESLTNTVKHAGPGSSCSIEIDQTSQAIVLQIRDHRKDPPAIELPPQLSAGLGLVGLQERVAALGGEIDWMPLQDGFLVKARLPIRSAALT